MAPALELIVHVAATARDRLRGLLGSPPPGDRSGLLLVGERAVHGLGMRYAVDLLFLDEQGVVVACAVLPPWRLRWCVSARHVVELRAGEIARLGLAVGQRPRLRVPGILAAETRPLPLPQPGRTRQAGWLGRVATAAVLLVLLLALLDPATAQRTSAPVAWSSVAPVAGSSAVVLPDPGSALGTPQPSLLRSLQPETVRQAARDAERLYQQRADGDALIAYRSLAHLAADQAPIAWLRIGNIHQRAGAAGAAIDAYRRAAEAEPASGQVPVPEQVAAQRKALLNLVALALDQSGRALQRLDAPVEPWLAIDPSLSAGVPAEPMPAIDPQLQAWQRRQLQELERQRSRAPIPERSVAPAGRVTPASAPPQIEYIRGDPARQPRRRSGR
ncbi:MAG: DUF192 domain-containing protein [Lautropia sp.]